MSSPRNSDPQRNSATLLALLGLMSVAGGLLLLAALVMPQALGILAVLCGFLFVGTFHYVVWGWWMSNLGSQDEEDHPS